MEFIRRGFPTSGSGGVVLEGADWHGAGSLTWLTWLAWLTFSGGLSYRWLIFNLDNALAWAEVGIKNHFCYAFPQIILTDDADYSLQSLPRPRR